jgi:hypothetical protein
VPWGGGEAVAAFLDGGCEIDLEATTKDRLVGRTIVPNGGVRDPGPGRRRRSRSRTTVFSDGKSRWQVGGVMLERGGEVMTRGGRREVVGTQMSGPMI